MPPLKKILIDIERTIKNINQINHSFEHSKNYTVKTLANNVKTIIQETLNLINKAKLPLANKKIIEDVHTHIKLIIKHVNKLDELTAVNNGKVKNLINKLHKDTQIIKKNISKDTITGWIRAKQKNEHDSSLITKQPVTKEKNNNKLEAQTQIYYKIACHLPSEIEKEIYATKKNVIYYSFNVQTYNALDFYKNIMHSMLIKNYKTAKAKENNKTNLDSKCHQIANGVVGIILLKEATKQQKLRKISTNNILNIISRTDNNLKAQKILHDNSDIIKTKNYDALLKYLKENNEIIFLLKTEIDSVTSILTQIKKLNINQKVKLIHDILENTQNDNSHDHNKTPN